MKKKPFIITIDTEGDNLWDYKLGNPITTENAKFLRRFQQLCDKYGFKPTYLVNYEMANSKDFVDFAKETLSYGGCEIGMHLHAWNNPPEFSLKERDDGCKSGLPYITEYDVKSIKQKIDALTTIIRDRIGVIPVSHRAGRWAMNEIYAKALEESGYKYDCTVTPLKSWKDCPGYSDSSYGNDYSKETNRIASLHRTDIKEFPFQGYKNHRIKIENIHSVRSFIKNIFYAWKRNEVIYLRPNGHNLNDLLYIVKKNSKSSQKYLMFMLHSSEFMPGGSPTFTNSDKIEKLYSDLSKLFNLIAQKYYGATLCELGESFNKKKH